MKTSINTYCEISTQKTRLKITDILSRNEIGIKKNERLRNKISKYTHPFHNIVFNN